MRGRWSLEQEIANVDEQLARVTAALREARLLGEHNAEQCEATRDELLDLRSLLVMQRGRSG